ncbi:MAG: SpoIIE family protein phosphatase [Planctomycetota bacterium]|nr:SpoIIE family protein phosphatase [Planctomycetota bacterium]
MTETHWDFLTGDTEKDQRNVRILLDSVEELYGPRTVADLMRSAVDRAIRVTGAERGILLLEGKDGELETAIARNADGSDLSLDELYSKTVVQQVWSSGEPKLMLDTADVHEADLTMSIVSLRLLSVMGVPMPAKGRNLGVLYVDSTAKVKEFTQSDFSVFQALGGLIALAVDNARLMAKEAEQERMKRELLVAQQIQQRLLPTDLPQPQGFEIAGLGRPCDEVSGDYYDVIPFGSEQLALVVGDVSGHGLGPAMLMATTRALLQAALLSRSEPAEVIRSVNVFLERDTPDNAFMSMFVGALDPAARTLQYVSAGHNPPLLYHPGGTLEELEKTGPVLGILSEAEYGLSEPRTLASGEVLILYTDGIYEAHDAANEMYGEPRFQDSFLRHAGSGASAADVIEGVLGDLEAFVGAQPLDDDVTCLVVRAL